MSVTWHYYQQHPEAPQHSGHDPGGPSRGPGDTPLDIVTEGVRLSCEDLVLSLQGLLNEFEALKNRFRRDRSLSALSVDVGLSTTLSEMQAMANRLQRRLESMRLAVVAMKEPQTSFRSAEHFSKLLFEVRQMCSEFAGKLAHLRRVTAQAVASIESQRRRHPRRGHYSKIITIDCSALAVMLLFLCLVWVSNSWREWLKQVKALSFL